MCIILIILIFSPDLSYTVKQSSQIMIRSSKRFTNASSKVFRCVDLLLDKILQFIDAGNLFAPRSSVNRAFFSLFPEFEDLVGNLIIGLFVFGFFEKLFFRVPAVFG